MALREIAPEFFVSEQLTAEDMPRLAAAGIRSVLNNRPDGEEAGQPGSSELEAAARAAGLDYRHVPVATRQVTAAEQAAFEAALEALPRPICAFCRTGTRAELCWANAMNRDGVRT